LDSSTLVSMAAAVRAGLPLEVVRSRHQLDAATAAALDLCQQFGSPPARTLDRLAQVAVANERARSELELAQAGPASSARLVLVLPLVVLGLAQLGGLHVLTSPSPLTLGSMFLGALLLLIGRQWSKRIVKAAEPNGEDPALALDAFASGMQGGLSPQIVIEKLSQVYPNTEAIREVIETSSRDGIAIADLALASADRLRLETRVAAETKIHQAGVRLMWPLGLAVLPAFILLAVIPLAASMIQGSQSSFAIE